MQIHVAHLVRKPLMRSMSRVFVNACLYFDVFEYVFQFIKDLCTILS